MKLILANCLLALAEDCLAPDSVSILQHRVPQHVGLEDAQSLHAPDAVSILQQKDVDHHLELVSQGSTLEQKNGQMAVLSEGAALSAQLQYLSSERVQQDALFDTSLSDGLLDSFDVSAAAEKLSNSMSSHLNGLDELNGMEAPSQDFAQRLQNSLAILRKRPDATRLLNMAGASATVAQALASGVRAAEAEATIRQLAVQGAPRNVALQQQVQKGVSTLKGLARSLRATTGGALGEEEDADKAAIFAESYAEFLKVTSAEAKQKIKSGGAESLVTKHVDDIIKVLGGEWSLAQIQEATRQASSAQSMIQEVQHRDDALKNGSRRDDPEEVHYGGKGGSGRTVAIFAGVCVLIGFTCVFAFGQ